MLISLSLLLQSCMKDKLQSTYTLLFARLQEQDRSSEDIKAPAAAGHWTTQGKFFL
jgi:hypothetical protein